MHFREYNFEFGSRVKEKAYMFIYKHAICMRVYFSLPIFLEFEEQSLNFDHIFHQNSNSNS